MVAPTKRSGIEALVATFPEDQQREFWERLAAPPLRDTPEEAEEKMANGEYRPGDRYVAIVRGEEVIVTFCGTVNCC